jgi:hypothetical protein
MVVEEPLVGGTLADVVRIGDTVRRRTRQSNEAVHGLLRHLEQASFDGSPKYLGIDAQGREILSYVEGDVTASGPVPGMYSDESLEAAAQLLRRMHDATRGAAVTRRSGWCFQIGAPTTGPVVCHNDLGPYNTIYRHGRPIAFIDWDLAAPAPPEWDVAYALWRFVPLYDDDQCAELGAPTEPRHRRMQKFLDAYGLVNRRHILSTLKRRQEVTLTSIRAWANEGEAAYRGLVAEGRLEEITHNLSYAAACAGDWAEALRVAMP